MKIDYVKKLFKSMVQYKQQKEESSRIPKTHRHIHTKPTSIYLDNFKSAEMCSRLQKWEVPFAS